MQRKNRKDGECMIFDELVVTEKALKDLKLKTDLQKNKALQDNTDTRYRIVLKQTESFISTLTYLYEETEIQKNEEILKATEELIDTLEKAVSTGLALQDDVTKSEGMYKNINSEMKKEWAKKYAEITGSTVSTLEAIKGIDSDNVESCLNKIQGAIAWELGTSQYMTMTNGLNEAKQLIVKLGLDDEIVSFLQNTNAGKATLLDLNEKVLMWIRDEKLEGKIRISFVRK